MKDEKKLRRNGKNERAVRIREERRKNSKLCGYFRQSESVYKI